LVNNNIIKYLVNQNKLIEATNTLEKALEKISLKDINESAMIKLKKMTEAHGQIFKYDTNLSKKKVCNLIYLKYIFNYLLSISIL